MSEMSISSTAVAPAIIEQSTAPSTVITSEAPAPVVMGALSDAAPTVDMRASESPMALSAHTPKMIKV